MLFKRLLDIYPSYMILRVYVTGDQELKQKYISAANKHNDKIFNSPLHIDAGFDLYETETEEYNKGERNVSDYEIKCSASIVTATGTYNTGYYLYPRSSISKTPLRLSNGTGIIDSGYRGNIMGAFDCFRSEYYVTKYDRLLQICAPSLMPIVVNIVESEFELGEETLRGAGGFGSTGR